MNEIVLLAITAGLAALGSLVSGVLCGLLFHALRGQRDRFTALEAKITAVDAKANETVQSVSYVRGRLGELGPIRDWRE